MARQGKTPPARSARPALDDSLLIRSAESLGRMIGSLQRQLDGASRKLGAGAGVIGAWSGDGNAEGSAKPDVSAAPAKTTRKRKAAKAGSSSGATKVRSTAVGKSKRAAGSAVAKRSAGRSKPGSRKTAKSSR